MPRHHQHAGFTLLEMLTVLTIVGILAAIAVPQFTIYKRKAFDLRALSDLHNASLAEEAYFIDHEEYLPCSGETCAQLPGISTLSPGVQLTVELSEAGFVAHATHPRGSGKTFVWDSDKGGLLSSGEG